MWEYRDIGRLFITVGGEESDNRGAEVGLWVEVILRVSLEVILHHLLRHTAVEFTVKYGNVSAPSAAPSSTSPDPSSSDAAANLVCGAPADV